MAAPFDEALGTKDISTEATMVPSICRRELGAAMLENKQVSEKRTSQLCQ